MATRRRRPTEPVEPDALPDAVPPRPRTLSDDLRARTDEELAALLAARPDLLHPVPADVAGLATRATTAVSTARALDALDRWRLQVAEVLAAGPDPMSGADVAATIPDAPVAAVEEALSSLRDRALVWGDTDGWHLVRAAREAFGPWPCGLGPSLATRPEVAPWAADPDAIAAALADAPPAAAELAALLAAGPPAGQLANAQRPVSVDSARTPVEWLLARGLLVPLDGETVVLPREVALALRGGRWVVAPEPVRATVAVATSRDPRQVDAAAGQQAHDAVRLVEDLCDTWAVTPPAELRNGGLGVRDLAATARALDVAERDAAALVEVARSAGLIASDQDESPVWLPTPGYDVWLSRGRAERWAALVRAWWAMQRVPALVGGRDDRGGRINALAPDTERGGAAAVRHEVLAILAEPAAGSVVARAAVVDVLDARLPRRGGPLRETLVDGTLSEAALLGVTGLGALATTGRALLSADGPTGAAPAARPDGGADPLAAAVEPLLPDPLDHVLLQADLTAVAPGPLDPSLARELALLADVESTGGATVYRFSEGSLRRALDTGRTASDVHALLASRSRTPVPQPLTYLVDDVARRHGAIRVGVASAYVRCDDETTLTALLADRRSAALRAFRLAPTVVAVEATVDETLAALRDMGFAPMAENQDGAVVVRRPDARRTSARLRPPRPVSTSGPTATLLAAAVRALRAGDRATTAPRTSDDDGQASGPLPRTTAAETITRLRAALDAGRSVRIGYADLHGRAVDRVVDPLTLERGFLTGYDHRGDDVQTYAIARITGVAELP